MHWSFKLNTTDSQMVDIWAVGRNWNGLNYTQIEGNCSTPQSEELEGREWVNDLKTKTLPYQLESCESGRDGRVCRISQMKDKAGKTWFYHNDGIISRIRRAIQV